MGGPPWDSKDLTADQNRRYRSLPKGGMVIPTAHGVPKTNFTLISLKVKVFSWVCVKNVGNGPLAFRAGREPFGHIRSPEP